MTMVAAADTRLLIVDDDAALCAALAEFLSGEGYTVQVASTGGAALDRLADYDPAVLLLDLRLPDVDGLEVMRGARQADTPPEVVLISGHATLDSAIAALDAGAAGYVVKPLDLPELRTLLARVVERRRLMRENHELYERAERDRGRLQALCEVSRGLAEIQDTDATLSLIVQEATRLLQAEAAGLRLVEGGDLVLRARTANAGAITARARIRIGESLSGRVVSTGAPIAVEDLADDPRHDPVHRSAAVATGFHGFLGVPLRLHGRVLGTLNVYTRRPRRFTADEIALLETFADHAALAIHKADLLRDAEDQRNHVTQILESTSDGIVFISADGGVRSANRRAASLFGFSPEGDDMALARIVDGDDSGAAPLGLPASVWQGGEGELVAPATHRVLHWVAQPTRNAAGTTAGMTLTFRDVTEEREMDRMKADFVSFVTHQLRTPLAGIKWLLELAAGKFPSEQSAEYVRDARESADRLIRLVNELLDASRLENQALAGEASPVDLRHLSDQVVGELGPVVASHYHQLVSEMPDEVPPVLADPEMLRQVLVNLVSNAVKYTPDGGAITIRLAVEDAALQWSIQDTGVGIPADAQRRLFEKFFRADNALALETEGTGLGLYMVRLIVERLGGQVWCESEEGRGSTFYLRLPLAEVTV